MENFDTIIEEASRIGDLNKVKEICESSDKYYCNMPFRIACHNGHIEIVRYLAEIFNIYDVELGFLEACSNGHLDIVRYLITERDFKEYEEGFVYACVAGKLIIVQYLKQCHEISRKNIDIGIRLANEQGHLNIARFLSE